MSNTRKCLECYKKGYSVGDTTKDMCSICYSQTVPYDHFLEYKREQKAKKPKKYEFFLFEGNQIMVDRDVAEMQNEGWELAGNVRTKFSEQSTGMPRMIVPLKRELV